MARGHLALLRRSTNRGERPASTDSGPPSPLPPPRDHRRSSDEEAKSTPPVSKLWFPRADLDVDWCPTTGAVVKLLFSLRLASALWSGISDCDEVYNYWEPLHAMLYGNGFQTWEYSPVYAIRSWLYIFVHSIPASLFRIVLPHPKLAIFITMRCALATLTMAGDYCLYKVVASRLGVSIARFYLIITMFSAGMFISSSAFLPSSWAMAWSTLAIAALLSERWFLSTLCVAIASLVGWPFAALLGLPTALVYIFIRRRIDQFILHSLLCALFVAGPLLIYDTFMYNKRVLAPLNIVLYNVFSGHGPDLYGVAPASYYVKNLVLNLNYASVLWVAALPLAILLHNTLFTAPKSARRILGIPVTLSYYRRLQPIALVFLSVSTWMAVFFLQPHKEERFLFPVFPLIALLTAISLDGIHRLCTHFNIPSPAYWLLGIFVVICFSRVLCLHRNYSGSMEAYKSLNDHLSDSQQHLDFSIRNDPLSVCVGKEWHRFPSSFFLPSVAKDRKGRERQVRLQFIQSEFRGLLPKPFVEGRKHFKEVSRIVPTEMNDENREEPTRYVPLDSCDYVIDLETKETTELEPNFSKSAASFLRPISRHPYLLPAHSHWFFRAFYVPFISDSHCVYGDYTLYQRIPPTVVTKVRRMEEEEERLR